ncbi:MAG: (Fe-S)-binding protein [Anaerolineales bacterium]
MTIHSMLLQSITLTRTLPCLADPGKIIVIGKPDSSLAGVIPYLATLPGVISYNPNTLTLTFRRPSGFMTLYPDKVYITQVKDTEEGLQLLEALTEAVNTTWDNRADLVAATKKQQAPRPLDIYTLLPQTNCGQCGEATCMAFACSLLMNDRQLAECQPLYDQEYLGDRLATLQTML